MENYNNGCYAHIISIDVLSLSLSRFSLSNFVEFLAQSRNFDEINFQLFLCTTNSCIKRQDNFTGTITCFRFGVHSFHLSHFGWFKAVFCFWSFSIFLSTPLCCLAACPPVHPLICLFVPVHSSVFVWRFTNVVLNLFPLVPFPSISCSFCCLVAQSLLHCAHFIYSYDLTFHSTHLVWFCAILAVVC